MQPINLLPPYIYDKQKKTQVAIIYGVALAGIVGTFIFLAAGYNATLNDEKTKLTDAQAKQTEYTSLDGKITTQKQNIADTQAKQDFIAGAQKYNSSWPVAFETMRDRTSDTILLKSLSIGQDHKRMDFTGFAQSEMLIARWWMMLRSSTDKFENVFINLPPHSYAGSNPDANSTAGGQNAFGAGGYPGAGRPGGFPGGGGFPGAGRPGGFPGGFPGGPGGFPGGARPGGGLAGFGGPAGLAGAGKLGGAVAGGRGGGFGGAAGGDTGEGYVENRRGLNFTGYVVLRAPLPEAGEPPTWPAGAAGAAASPFGGGFPGGPGGFPGASAYPGAPPGAFGGRGRPPAAGAPAGGGRAAGGKGKGDD